MTWRRLLRALPTALLIAAVTSPLTYAAGTKLSDIASGGAINTATDKAVTVRSGTTDVLTTFGTLASKSSASLTADVTGVLPIANGGTALSSLGAPNKLLSVNGAGTALAYSYATNQNLQTVDSVTFANFSGSSSGTNTGDVTLGTFGSTPNSKGLSITGQSLVGQPADATHPGFLSNAAQSITGLKTLQTPSAYGVMEPAQVIYNPGPLVYLGGQNTGSELIFRFNNSIGSAQSDLAIMRGWTYDRNFNDGPDGAFSFDLWYENGGYYTTPITFSIHGLAMNPTTWGAYVDVVPTGMDNMLQFWGAYDPINTSDIQYGVGSDYIPDGNNGTPIYVAGDHFSMAMAFDQSDGGIKWYQTPGTSGGFNEFISMSGQNTMSLSNLGDLSVLHSVSLADFLYVNGVNTGDIVRVDDNNGPVFYVNSDGMGISTITFANAGGGDVVFSNGGAGNQYVFDPSVVFSGGTSGITASEIGSGTFAGSYSFNNTITLNDAANFVIGTSTGTKIGTGTNQKLGFYNVSPIVQPANTVPIDGVIANLGLRAPSGLATFAATIKPRAGGTTAGSGPLQFTSASLLTAPVVGTIEFFSDKYYATITTGTARAELTLNDSALTSGRVPFATTNGRLNDSSALTFSAGTLTATAFAGSGASLTSLNAGNISSGTLAVARGGTGQTTPVVVAGSFSQVGAATTTFTVMIGATQANTTYKVNVTPTDTLAAAGFYVTNKTTTSFDVVYLAGLTGTVTFDWALFT